MAFDTVHRVRVRDRDIAYREVGEGPPLLLVHGWPLCSATWRKVVPGLAGKTRCIALDLPGAGASAAPAGARLTIGAQAEAVLGLADAIGLERFALCGHDSGGSVARAAAVAAPDRVTELILADTEVPGHHPWQVVVFQQLARLPGAAALLGRVLGSRGLARSPLGFGTAFADLRRFDFDEFHAAVLAPLAHSTDAVRGCHRFLCDFSLADVDALRQRYGVLDIPTLVLWGERDRFFPIAEGRTLPAMLPGRVRFEAVANAGLLVHEEQPAVWARLVGAFLAEAGTARAAASA